MLPMSHKTMVIILLSALGLALFVEFFIEPGNRENARIRRQQQVMDAEEASKVVFNDWKKYTGNPNNLTYKEWKRLKDANLLNKNSK